MSFTTAEEAGVEVGTVFRNSWGYDQTNVDFLEVVKVSASGKSVTVQPIQSTTVHQGGAGGNRVVPAVGVAKTRNTGEWVRNEDGTHRFEPGPEEAEATMTKRVQVSTYDDRAFITMPHGWCGEWEGEPEYETSLGFGH